MTSNLIEPLKWARVIWNGSSVGFAGGLFAAGCDIAVDAGCDVLAGPVVAVVTVGGSFAAGVICAMSARASTPGMAPTRLAEGSGGTGVAGLVVGLTSGVIVLCKVGGVAGCGIGSSAGRDVDMFRVPGGTTG